MKRGIILSVFVCLFCFSLIYCESIKIPDIVSSTFLTQDLSENSPDIEVLTSEDIKALGIRSIPELLRVVNSLNIYTLNESTVDISLRGFPSIYKLNPLILIDGMEISENVYDRTYLYNLPVDIQDIDRVEILKNTSITVNGLSNQFGIINIVTKPPETLDSNFIYGEAGSESYKKGALSFNRYYKGFYFKASGFTRRIAQNDPDFKMADSSCIGAEVSKYFRNSRLFFKATLMREDVNFKEKVGIRRINLRGGYLVRFYNNLKDLKHFNSILNYKSENFDFSFYYQTYFGKVFMKIPLGEAYYDTNNRFYKVALRRKFYFKNNSFLVGGEGRYRYAYIQSIGNMKRFSGNVFVQDQINLPKNFGINFYLNFDRTKNLGEKFSYKLSFIYSNREKSTWIRLGFSKEFKKPFMGFQYFSYNVLANKTTFPLLGRLNLNQIVINYNGNKSLSSYKVKTTEFVFSKRIQNLKFDFTLFYNLIYDIPLVVGTFGAIPPAFSLKPFNINDICTTGIDFKTEYKFNKFKFTGGYYHQRIKDKVRNRFIHNIPENKFTLDLRYLGKDLTGSIALHYISSFINNRRSTDTYTLLDFSLTKPILKNLKATLKVNNIFNNKHIEGVLGDKIGRTFMVRLKYDF